MWNCSRKKTHGGFINQNVNRNISRVYKGYVINLQGRIALYIHYTAMPNMVEQGTCRKSVELNAGSSCNSYRIRIPYKTLTIAG